MRKLIFIIFLIIFFTCIPRQVLASVTITEGRIFEWHTNSLPKTIHGSSGFTEVANGAYHSIALKSDGTVWAWGENGYGQLGNGTTVDNTSMTQVKGPAGNGFLANIISVSATEKYSMALRNDGTVWVWGFNGFGSRGTGISIGDTQAPPLLYPTQVKKSSGEYLTNITEIAAGANHSLALQADGSVRAWGGNDSGQLGIGCFSEVTINCSHRFYAIPISNFGNVKSIVAGRNHSLTIKNDGSVWGWGRAFEGQLGSASNGFARLNTPTLIPGLNNIIKIGTNYYISAAVSNEGLVYEWGSRGLTNILGPDPRLVQNLSDVVEIGIGRETSFAVRKDGTVWQWDRYNIVAQQVPNLSNIVFVAGSIATPNLAVEKFDPSPSPFLDLPFDYESQGKSFEEVLLNPSSWFDHKYPLQNIPCCTFKALLYTGEESKEAYRSHSGYDYASASGVKLNTQVLAAADGIASFKPASKSAGAGNMIKIDHGNGYQTWYEHLSKDGLVTSEESNQISVSRGDVIGLVGMTGKTTGPHIHLSVFHDNNENNSFSDDYPLGLVDPLGWEGETNDLWEEYKKGDRYGSKSYYLFRNKIPNSEMLISDIGGELDFYNLKIEIPEDAYNGQLNLKVKLGPYISGSSKTKSAVPSYFIEAYDSLGEKVTTFQSPIYFTFNYSNANLNNIDEDTLKIYYFNKNTNEWEELASYLNKSEKTITLSTTHFSQYALMGEVIDQIPPQTSAILDGEMGDTGWYSSNVVLSFESKDNEGGLGIDEAIYTTDGENWNTYTTPLTFSDEGKYSVSFMSYDLADNREEIKTLDFYIDKTPPVVSISVNASVLWPPNGKLVPVKIDGYSEDPNLKETKVFVMDEYNSLNLNNLAFGQIINLESKRDGNDLDGRFYNVIAEAKDKAGNVSSSQVQVVVPHDMGN